MKRRATSIAEFLAAATIFLFAAGVIFFLTIIAAASRPFRLNRK
jgi:hypothetical protein